MSGKPLHVVVLGLSLSSSWGNGHATTYRALLRALAACGHKVLFLERDVPWYAAHRDLPNPDFCVLRFYDGMADLCRHKRAIVEADAVIVGSYVPDGIEVGRYVQRIARGVTAFYDIDTPVTLAKLERGENDYLSTDLVAGYDLYLSFTAGPTLRLIEQRYGAPAALALHCSVDTDRYRPLALEQRYDLGYLGTYSPDRQPVLERLLLEPARRASHLRFVVAGPLYPPDIAWPDNVKRIEHVPPAEHPAFYASCRFTLNVTRADMVKAGFSPSVRLFEAAACATPIISDDWPGLDRFFTPGREIVLARTPEDVLEVLTRWPVQRSASLASAARRRVLSEHSAIHRARELERHLVAAMERPSPLETRPKVAQAAH